MTRTRTAYRVTRRTAEAAFRNGDAVVVSDREHGPLFTVYPGTTLNTAADDYAWQQLADAVDSWGRRQTFYVLPAAVDPVSS